MKHWICVKTLQMNYLGGNNEKLNSVFLIMRLKKLENQLQIEESRAKIATIQGKLTEFRSMMQKKVWILYFAKGWYFPGKNAVNKQYEFLKEKKNSSLPFDEGFDDVEV